MSDIYDWKKALTWLEDSVRSTYVDTSDFDRAFDPWIDRLAAHIERLEAERDALLAEHEAARRYLFDQSPDNLDDLYAAHDNAERVGNG